MEFLDNMRKFSHNQNKEPLFEHILSNLRFQKAARYIKSNTIVADLGCGYHGKFLKTISKRIKLGVGYDVSISKKGLPKNVILKNTDLNKLIDNKKDYFNIVSALAVLEHVNSPPKFMDKIYKLLKNEGLVILTTPHKYGKPILELLSSLRLISKDEIDDHKNYFDTKSLKKLLKHSGFKIIEIGLFGIGWLNLFCIAKKASLQNNNL